MRILITLFLSVFLSSTALSQQSIVADIDYVEIEIHQGIGHMKVMYRSAVHKFQYVKDDAGKNFKFQTLAQVFVYLEEQGFVYVATTLPTFINTNSHAYLFKKS